MKTQTRPRVSKISGTLMHKQVAQSQLRQSHRPWNVENIREESGEVKEASFCLFHFREQTQNLVQENISGESNKGTIIRREGLRPFGETDGCCSVVCVVCSVLQNNCHYTCLVLKQLSERLASVLTALCPCLMEKEEQKNVLETLSWSFNFHGRDESMCDVTNSEDRFMLSLLGCFFYLIFYFLLNNRNPTWVTVIYLSNCLQ